MTHHNRTRWVLLSFGATALIGCAPAQSNTTFADGVIFSSCAPYDGAALEARIPTSSKNLVAMVRVNEPLNSKAIVRSITGIGSPGGAAVHVCQPMPADPKHPTMPQVMHKSCKEASSGWVRLGGIEGDGLKGGVDVVFKDGTRMSGEFATKWLRSEKPQVCG